MMIAEEHSLLLPAAPDLIWGTVAFVVIALAVYKLAWPTFLNVLDERRQKIDEGLRAAAIARDEVEAERAKLAEERNEAHREAAAIREQAQANASEIVADAQKAAQAEAKRISEATARQIAADTEVARRTLQSDVGTLASDLASRIVGAQMVDEQISKKVVDSFLDELEAALPAKVNEEA